MAKKRRTNREKKEKEKLIKNATSQKNEFRTFFARNCRDNEWLLTLVSEGRLREQFSQRHCLRSGKLCSDNICRKVSGLIFKVPRCIGLHSLVMETVVRFMLRNNCSKMKVVKSVIL